VKSVFFLKRTTTTTTHQATLKSGPTCQAAGRPRPQKTDRTPVAAATTPTWTTAARLAAGSRTAGSTRTRPAAHRRRAGAADWLGPPPLPLGAAAAACLLGSTGTGSTLLAAWRGQGRPAAPGTGTSPARADRGTAAALAGTTPACQRLRPRCQPQAQARAAGSTRPLRPRGTAAVAAADSCSCRCVLVLLQFTHVGDRLCVSGAVVHACRGRVRRQRWVIHRTAVRVLVVLRAPAAPRRRVAVPRWRTTPTVRAGRAPTQWAARAAGCQRQPGAAARTWESACRP